MRPGQLTARQVAHVVRHHRLGMARDGQLDQMVVAFIGQVGAPAVVHRHPTADTRQRSQHLPTLLGRSGARPDITPQQILVLLP